MHCEERIAKDVEGSGCGLIWDDIPEYIWVKPRKTIVSLAGLRAESWSRYLSYTKQKCSLLTASSMERDIKSVLFCARFYSAFKLTKFTASYFYVLLSRSWRNLTGNGSRGYKPQVINLFKPSCYYVNQQVLCSKTLQSAHRLYICPSYDSHNEATFPTSNWPIDLFIGDRICLCAVWTVYLTMMQVKLGLQRVNLCM